VDVKGGEERNPREPGGSRGWDRRKEDFQFSAHNEPH